MSDSTELARAVVSTLIDNGVREAVLSPGSRNAPLSFALLAASRSGAIRLHVRIDERSAGFLALGLSRASGRPVAVACTSGTAVANLAPAVLEASHVDAQVIVLAADRPESLRGTSASQTTDQIGLLRARTVDVSDAYQVRGELVPLLNSGGPVHLNLQFAEPLTPGDDWSPRPAPAAANGFGIAAPRRSARAAVLDHGPRTVVVAGDDAGGRARMIAERGGWPLLAEPSSGARDGAHALRTYRLLLSTELGEQVERVILLGHPTLSRPVSRLLARREVQVVDLDPRWAPRPFRVDVSVHDVEIPTADEATATRDAEWLETWRREDWALGMRIDTLLAEDDAVTPYEAAAAVAKSLRSTDLLFVGPSNPIRDLDLMAPVRGRAAQVMSNRGLAGIDGVVSSAIGAALATQAVGGTRAVALMGDVTFLHDSNGLVIGPDEPRPDLTIVVVNDDGGSIFAVLEQGAPEYANDFERIFGTPHGVDVASLCAATRTPHWKVTSALELQHALAHPAGGIEVIEVQVGRADRREMDERIKALAHQR
ncbi:2-succinyl-5-enolpyruvyl-6-hydroxy-3-cyclohexene-1-carboxylic-acid synthase [Nocardioides yefusunii]|uniref:2-succinyl-5-enolpyruvyl-6-hydroxy-3-cyclohexene-1-carboxylate synthase n=1 Tax=Nocardioides yefusunii TaxID=2500546 RepID=A0ABW1R054_9ACTN|nr:2-succinyl-5-enolpyruvyl-6-hydroxy-3-cyclohexene-1-carboxylic-acid synthase [Nocardioides yefusunii]